MAKYHVLQNRGPSGNRFLEKIHLGVKKPFVETISIAEIFLQKINIKHIFSVNIFRKKLHTPLY